MSRLGWSDDDDRYLKGRPKGMHWRTYHRLLADLDRFESASNGAFFEYFGARFGDLDLGIA